MKVICFLGCVFFCVHAYADGKTDSKGKVESQPAPSVLILLPAPLPPKDTGIGVESY